MTNSQVPEEARLEIKFVAAATERHAIREWLRRHSAGFVDAYPDRTVHNVYFDTYDYTSFVDNLSGASTRTKVRYRWYGTSLAPDAGWLEIKQKRNYFGWKQRDAVAESPYRDRFDWRQIRQSVLDQVSPETGIWLEATPQPVMANRYARQYFVDTGNTVRVTLDTEQAVWDQRLGPRPNFHRRANLPDLLIVEFKFSRNARAYASDMIQGFPIRVSRSSKYVSAVKAIAEGAI
jgi:hypothetical protein